MTPFRKYIITILLSFIFTQVYCQTNLSTHSPINLKLTVLDTLKVENKSMIINVLWLSDTIKINILNQDKKTDTSSLENIEHKGYFASKGYVLSDETSIQNCFSYALEKYFENNETFSQNIFRKTTSIKSESLEKILRNSFKVITEFSTTPRKNLKKTIPNDVLLAFVNNFGWIIHTVYYRDEIFYTKNGMFEPNTFKSLNKFIKKTYWDTEHIIVYKIDDDKIKTKLNNLAR
ncbi:hypothetical protein [Ancylomarina sp. 16SWW S1-10-2]|uniref:hypothetical protein n=1 Tax=Ancylomarina sp. 16SWW S1-10-2 TaxID=2499681 RepID=UPI0012AD4C81|nr:hypothetical protein [Ancylomarina sp. 16SWW S1-10-2]MRT92275.1 hypothetical protein [Ancylomarina sp. 16SWW S1-10-2]